jgi:Rieske Fe-S protein
MSDESSSRGTPSDALAAPWSGVRRRSFLQRLASISMLAGLALGYGTFFALAGRFLFPARRKSAWLFVARATQIAPGQSMAFASPAGLPITVKRSSSADPARAPVLDQFAALSSTCPHLGCRVHWEAHNNRFFCPCHNGTFDPDGNPTGGPPLAANQHLPRYPLRLEGGMLFIEIRPELADTAAASAVSTKTAAATRAGNSVVARA